MYQLWASNSCLKKQSYDPKTSKYTNSTLFAWNTVLHNNYYNISMEISRSSLLIESIPMHSMILAVLDEPNYKFDTLR